MFFRQYYLGCLSHASYLVGDETTGRAVVVDPQRDVAEYLRDAAANGLTIERVIETHFHADFVSGHLELQAATGAAIAYGPTAQAEYTIEVLEHGQHLSLGEVDLEIRHTPGHTPESICIVVREHADDDVPFGVLTGDTLFIGDVGRPDLLASKGMTAAELGGLLYHSLRDQLLTLPDATQVFPAHGAGSACGKSLSTETVSTIGEQRRTNYALADMTEDEFVARVTADQPAAPPYFLFDVTMNRSARAALEETEPPAELDWDTALQLVDAGAVVVDTREHTEFARGHLRGALNVGLGGRFAEYCGDVVSPDTDIVLVTDPGTELEARVRLARIGFDRVVGALDRWADGFIDHPDAVTSSSRVTAGQLAAHEPGRVQIVDVRNPGETNLGMIPGAVVIPLAHLAARVDELDADRPTVVHCAGGYRSSLAASLLEARGFADVSDLLGGFDAWIAAGHPVVRPVAAG
jgi:glyoxylase-like metal-dependent hydrolase (beta-lactamase superfamily II)/rhodanese-related sulfurtransferase